MALPSAWAGVIAEPIDPGREQCVRHLRVLADELDNPTEYLVVVLPFAARLLSGEGTVADYWFDLGVGLQIEMFGATQELGSRTDDVALRAAADYMRLAANRIEEAGR